MSKVLKSSYVKVDKENRVSIDIKNDIKNSLQMVSFTDVVETQNIKKNTLPSPICIIEQAKKSAELILKNAEIRSKNILDEAREISENLAEEIEEESREKGYFKGYKEGLEQANYLKQDARKVYEDAINEKENIINSLESEILELIVNIVDKLLVNAIHINPKIIMALIKQGIASSSLAGDIKIRVSSQDYEYVSENRDEVYKIIDASVKMELMKDQSLNKSDCVIETNFGNIDCGLDVSFNSLKESLYYIYNVGDGSNGNS